MRSKLISVGVLTGALLGLLGTVTPAHATTEATALFVGDARTSPLGYPCTPVGTTTNCPPPIGTQPTFGFSFGSTTCVGTKTDILKPKSPQAPVVTYGPECSITAAGTGTGYCGSSKADGTATITYSGPTGTKTITTAFLYVGVGGTLVVTGFGQKTPGGPTGVLLGVVEAIPNPTQGSCTDSSATGFLIAGAITYTEVTPPPV